MRKFFTSESVTEGHPDKVCDQIADAILDALLAVDPEARVACEVTATTGLVLLMGEITAKQRVDFVRIARDTIRRIGYDRPDLGFDCNTAVVLTVIDEQSPDIAMGVNEALEARAGGDKYDTIGAGDQGMMFGYATDETPEKMPLALTLSHALTKRLAAVRKEKSLNYLRPDGKSQVTVEYEDGNVKRIEAVVLSSQHDPDVDIETLRADLKRVVIDPVLPPDLVDANTKYYINPTGRFVVGGPHGDSGVTGRKLIVDTYGGYAAHGGGAFSGKDPTKVDRSASYYVRYAAKNIIAAGLAKKVELQVAYAIGKAEPVSLCVNTFGTGTVCDEQIAEGVKKVFDFRPAAIIDQLELRKPGYERVASYGHFGRTGVTWEKEDRADALKRAVYGN